MSLLVGSLIVPWALHKPGPGRLALVAGVCLLLFPHGQRTEVLRCHHGNRSGRWMLLLAAPEKGNTRVYTVVSGAGALALAPVVCPALSALDIQPAAAAAFDSEAA